MKTEITLTFAPEVVRTDEDDNWIKLQQFEYSDVRQAINFNDIYQMWINAQQGLSAFAYVQDDCPMTITENGIIIALDFYVFPSEMNLPYTLSASIGELGEGQILTSLDKEFDLIFPLSKVVELDYVADNLELTWLAGPRTARNQPISPIPTITADGRFVRSSVSMFAVFRARCQAQCYLHTVLIRLEKFGEEEQEDGTVKREVYKIENLKSSVTATWTRTDGGIGKEILELKIPKCVEDFLTWCPDGTLKGYSSVTRENRVTRVFYNACTGDHIATITTND